MTEASRQRGQSSSRSRRGQAIPKETAIQSSAFRKEFGTDQARNTDRRRAHVGLALAFVSSHNG